MLIRHFSFALLFALLLGVSARPGAAQTAPVYNPANGHWYELVRVSGQMTWSDARSAAQSLSYAGFPGHLVTVTSAAEEQFVVGSVLSAVSDNEWWWMGGYQDTTAPDYREPAGGWRWVTGEPWSYIDWGVGQPDNGSGIEHYLGYFQAKQWNDFTTSNPGIHGYVVEFEPSVSPSPAGTGQLVLFPNPAQGGQPALGQVTLAQPAGVGGEVITLTSGNPAAAAVPATVTVPAGASSATFVISTLPVTLPTPVVITAGCNFGSASVTLQVLPLPGAPASVGPNLLFNGSFEQPQITDGNAIGGISGNGLPGWQITRGNIDLLEHYWQQAPGQGNQSLDLVGSPGAATIEQTFPTQPGQQYLFSGWVSHNWGVSEGRANVSVNGVFFVQLYQNIPGTAENMHWTYFSYPFQATTTATTLSIADVTNLDPVRGTALDGLSVTPASGSTPPAVYPAGGLAAPSNLTATMATNGRVRLDWSDNSTGETGFVLWRKGGGSDWTKLGALLANNTAFTDTVVNSSTLYTYRVQATSAAAASDFSNEASLTTPAAPAAPFGLMATAAGTGQISLNWQVNPGNSTAVEVYRQAAGGDWKLIAALSPGSTSYFDRGLTPGGGYVYRLRAANDYFASGWSNQVGLAAGGGV